MASAGPPRAGDRSARRDERDVKRPDPAARARAEQLESSGMPMPLALAVAYGKLSLNDALERLARKETPQTFRGNILAHRGALRLSRTEAAYRWTLEVYNSGLRTNRLEPREPGK